MIEVLAGSGLVAIVSLLIWLIVKITSWVGSMNELKGAFETRPSTVTLELRINQIFQLLHLKQLEQEEETKRRGSKK